MRPILLISLLLSILIVVWSVSKIPAIALAVIGAVCLVIFYLMFMVFALVTCAIKDIAAVIFRR